MTCAELRAEEATLLQAIDDTRRDIDDAKAELIDDSAHKQFWEDRIDALQQQLAAQATQLQDVRNQIAAQCLHDLAAIIITFDTHDEGKDHDTVLHVFVKNRRGDSSTPERQQDFLSNLAAWRRHAQLGSAEKNPYLGFGEYLGQDTAFEASSSHTFDVSLRAGSIPVEEIVLPVVDVHILPNGHDRWAFSYTGDVHLQRRPVLLGHLGGRRGHRDHPRP
jgi:hypothetical protein